MSLGGGAKMFKRVRRDLDATVNSQAELKDNESKEGRMKKFYMFAVIALIFAAGISAASTAYACGGDKTLAGGDGDAGTSEGK